VLGREKITPRVLRPVNWSSGKWFLWKNKRDRKFGKYSDQARSLQTGKYFVREDLTRRVSAREAMKLLFFLLPPDT
jgi:hypothetical protein